MGLGDLGPKGLATFQEQHVCNIICEKLGLDRFEAPSSSKIKSAFSSDNDDDNEDLALPSTDWNPRIPSKPKKSRNTNAESSKTVTSLETTKTASITGANGEQDKPMNITEVGDTTNLEGAKMGTDSEPGV